MEREELLAKNSKTMIQPSVMLGIFLCLLSGLLLALSSSCVQMLEEAIPDWQLNITRNFGAFVCVCVIVVSRKTSLTVERHQIPLVAFSSMLFFGSAYFLYVAVNYLPIATTHSLSLTFNLLFGVIIYRIWLQETITCLKCLSIVVSVLGIYAIIQPSFLPKLNQDSNTKNISTEDNFTNVTTNESIIDFADQNTGPVVVDDFTSVHSHFQIMIFGYMYAILHGIVTSSRTLTYKILTGRQVDTFIVMFWGSLLGIAVSIILTLSLENPVIPSSIKQFLLILGHGSSIGLRHTTLILQIRYLDATVSSVICVSAGAAFMVLFQYTFLQHIMPGNRNVLEVCGVILVVYGATQTALVELFKSKKQNSDVNEDSPAQMTKIQESLKDQEDSHLTGCSSLEREKLLGK